MGSDLYMVSGTRLYRVTSSLSYSDIGEIKGTGNVYTTTNEQHVLIVTDGEWAYAANQDGVIQIAETGLVGAACQDGYAIAGKKLNEQFYISDLDDITSWTATEFSSADAIADPLVNLLSLHRRLMIFGSDTIEWWSNTGAADFPFARDPGGFAEVGLVAAGSAAKAGNTAFWLGQEFGTGGKAVYRANGYQPEMVSTHGIANVIEKRASPQTAWSFVYTQEQHTFYVLSFSDKTMVFDLSTGMWHYRKSKGMNRWRANCHAHIWGKNVVGDVENGKLYELDLDTYTEDGDTIRREADSAPVHANGDPAIMHEFFVDLEAGVGLDGSGQGSDPEMMISWSDNHGKTWGNEIIAKIGKTGEYDVQARIWALGEFRQRSMRIAISDPVPAHIIGAWCRLEPTTL